MPYYSDIPRCLRCRNEGDLFELSFPAADDINEASGQPTAPRIGSALLCPLCVKDLRYWLRLVIARPMSQTFRTKREKAGKRDDS